LSLAERSPAWQAANMPTPLQAMKSISAALALFALTVGALAQEKAQENVITREVKGKSGQDIRIAVFTTVRPDCGSGPLPTIRLVRPPEHGNVVVKKGQLNATNIKQCLALQVPALVAIYRSAAGFEGSDSAILEIKSESGVAQLQRYTITVSAAGGGQKI
jgi:hypothetical protein